MHSITIIYGCLVILACQLLYSIVSALISPTRSIPGPFLARFTRLYYFRIVWTGQAEKHNIALHKKYAKDGQFYAPIIRLGPNLFSIIEPDKQIFGIGSKMPKTAWYEGWKHPDPNKWTLFPDQNIQRHAETRKKFQNIYSMSSLKSYETYVDECIDIFEQRLSEMADHGNAVDMGHWLQCYAFDVIGNITYSKRFGFLDAGKDIDGIILALDRNMPYATLVGIYHWLHPYLYQVMQLIPGTGAAARQKLLAFTQKNKALREEQRKAWEVEGKGIEEKAEGLPEDFLDKMLNMKRDEKRGVTDYHCFIMGLSNIIAGSDTTAVSLSATLYHLIRTPRAMQKLRDEIRSQTKAGECEVDRVSFDAGLKMPYLQACLKEALRLHAAVGLPLWREVIDGGVEVSGQYFPAGSEIGINAWVTHYNQDIWGKDAHEFRPERWIEAEQEGGEKLKYLEHHYLPFGLGSRTCLGRHISYLEMTKLIPQMVRIFDFELQRPGEDWSCQNFWFVKPDSFHVKVSRLTS